MNPSIFVQWVDKYFPGMVTRVSAYYNGQNTQGAAYSYYFMKYLKKKMSMDGKWASLNVYNSLIAADIVAMDSPLPLKKRPSLGQYTGDIPKLGLELQKKEKQISDLQVLVARLSMTGDDNDAEIAAQIMDDVPLVIGAIYERLEAAFLEGLSTGSVVIDDTETVGTGIRIDYGYRASNAFQSTLPWSNVNATPFSDMQVLLDYADFQGDTVVALMMDRKTFNNVAKTTEGKAIYSAFAGFVAGSGATPTPTLEQMNRSLADKYGYTIEIIDRSIRVERNGVRTSFKPWKAGAVVAVTTLDLGSYVWTTLAELYAPVNGVNYQLTNDFILVSKYSVNRPSLMEVTNSQARVCPVIDNTQHIYTMDSTATTV